MFVLKEAVVWHPDDFLFIPLYGSHKRMVGIVSVDDPSDGRAPTAEGLSSLELFAHQVAQAIEEKKLDQEVKKSTRRPVMLERAALALGLLGDKNAVPVLCETLTNSKSLTEKAAVAAALGLVGDQRAVHPLVAMLTDTEVSDRSRAFAAVALGNVADPDRMPWKAVLTENLNYSAAPPTLLDNTMGAGLLNIL